MSNAVAMAGFRSFDLPWSGSDAQDRRFRRLALRLLLLLSAMALAVPWLPVLKRETGAPAPVPARLARLVMERRPPPPPPPAQVDPQPEPSPAPQTGSPATRPAPAPKADSPPVQTAAAAREAASRAGVMRFADTLAALRRSGAVAAATASQPLLDSGPATGDSLPARDLIARKAKATSGGIDTAGLSRRTGGVGLGERRPGSVAAVAGVPGGGGGTSEGAASLPARSREEIELVFDRNKGAIYALYRRALRSNPALQGKVVLELTIAPDGSVSGCRVVSSDLGDAELERKLVQRVLLFRFDAKDVAPVTTTKPIDFFPA